MIRKVTKEIQGELGDSRPTGKDEWRWEWDDSVSIQQILKLKRSIIKHCSSCVKNKQNWNKYEAAEKDTKKEVRRTRAWEFYSSYPS